MLSENYYKTVKYGQQQDEFHDVVCMAVEKHNKETDYKMEAFLSG